MHHSFAADATATSPIALRVVDPSIRSQIDSYIAAGLHTRVPATDPRILPARRSLDWDSIGGPTASAGDVLSATRSRRRAAVARVAEVEAAEGWPPADAVVLSVGECAAAAGSKRALRYKIWTVGATIGELRSRGLRLSDLRRDTTSGRVVLSAEAGSGTQVPEEAEESI